ncbi:PREDICTED: flavin-containing monooxygenase FMO GS-OX5-like [Camelina sativa]|uniref:Flavin-containing monooxygenase n=1 Tax=Camelina sativa TaxID=90675 RepID=A0ABM0Y0W0_CAMSA|nr:PREDICTED: flavin-containing monooxygenase FMO GS-OX5-like [Camelina sativa]
MAPAQSTIKSLHVAVIGAGAAGLVAARELRDEDHSVVVFERDSKVGGLWVYTPESEVDPLSLDPNRTVVHSSVYDSLRTNLPRECMGYRDFPFVPQHDVESRDPRRYPTHKEVLAYLEDFAREFKLVEMVRFNTEVVLVEPDGLKWRVQSKTSDGISGDEIFDAVVVCNGHYTEPRVAHVPGIDSWPGKQIHSHNYRVPDPFKDQVVVVIGNFASGTDISRDIMAVAKEVHIASRSNPSETYKQLPGSDNLWLHSMIKSGNEDGSIVFENGKVVQAVTIVHCTGYKYYFPFLNTNGYITVEDNCVGPLYKHVFPPALAPGLSFVGVPWMTLLFFMFELQSKWVAAVLSGRIKLPSEDKMMEDVTADYAMRDTHGLPKRYTHRLGAGNVQYLNWIAEQVGAPPGEQWRFQELDGGYVRLATRPDTFRDKWDDDHLIVEAYEGFLRQKLIKSLPSELLESGK